MLEENVWINLTDEEKFTKLKENLQTIFDIDNGKHVLSRTREQGKLAAIKKELVSEVQTIIEIENGL